MDRRLKLAIGGAAIIAAVAAGVGIAAAGVADDDETEVPIPRDDHDKASAAALEVTGGGTVTETEVGDEEGYYEVEVTLEDGSQVDVHLDRAFRHVGSEADAGDDEAVDDE